MYPDRNISTPEAIPGRQHSEIQTEEYFERLQDKPQSDKIGVATEFYLDRPPVPLF
jgi:radial spoke head protein 3